MRAGFDLWRSIYPVFIKDRAADEGELPIRFGGTAFFVNIEGFTLLMTARHVGINRETSETKELHIAERLGDKGRDIRIEGAAISKDDEDFAAMWVFPHSLERFEQAPIPLTICADYLMPFQDVFTLAFPLNSVDRDDRAFSSEAEMLKVEVNHMHLKGHVTRELRAESIPAIHKPFRRNYVLNIPGYRGMSGAPLLTEVHGKPMVSGIFFAAHEINYGGEDYEFALTSTHEPIMELREILLQLQQQRKK